MPQIIKDFIVLTCIMVLAFAAYAVVGDEPCAYLDTCGVMVDVP